MKINPVHALLSLLQQQAETAAPGGKKSVNLAKLIDELKAAADPQSKVAIVERIQKELGVQKSEALRPRPELMERPLEEKPGAWRMSSATTESMNGLAQQRSARHWELEAVIQALMNNPKADTATVDKAGVATPFRPTAEDVEKAIESLGLTPRQLFRDDLHDKSTQGVGDVWPEAVQRLLLIMVGLGVLFTVALVI